ncbi:3-phenylpropionate/cinnamic acid dioxygenase ferredoxin subunit [subsurface metagenome]
MALTRVAAAADIPAGILKKFDVGDLEITVANVEGSFYAFEDRCPHMNTPLHQGKLEGKEVVCPLHKARFDVMTGKKTAEPRIPIPKVLKIGALMAAVRTHDLIVHAVKVENGTIFVKH